MWFARSVGRVFAVLFVLLPAVSEAQTYTYTGAPLQPITSNSPNCPNISNITGTVTFPQGLSGPVIGTLTAGSLSVDISASSTISVNSSGVIIGWDVVGYSAAINIGTGGVLDNSYLGIYSGDDSVGETLIDRNGNTIGCSYSSYYKPGTWTVGPVANNLGGPMTPCSSAPLQSSPFNPAAPQFSDPVMPGSGCMEGEPMNAATGNTFLAEKDFAADPHTGLALTRYYNSQDTTSSAFGKSWHSTWHRGLTVSGNDGDSDARGRTRGYVHQQWRRRLHRRSGRDEHLCRDHSRREHLTGWQLRLADDTIETYTLSGLAELASPAARGW